MEKLKSNDLSYKVGNEFDIRKWLFVYNYNYFKQYLKTVK